MSSEGQLLGDSTSPLGTSEDDHRSGGGADVGSTFHRIPQQVGSDEHVLAVVEERGEVVIKIDDHFQLFGILRHGLLSVSG